MSYGVPTLKALPDAPQTQEKGGIQISVAPISYEVVWDTVDERSRTSSSFGESLRLGTAIGENESLDDYQLFDVTRRLDPTIHPERLRFVITINNQMNRVFRGAGAVVQFNAGGQLLAVDQEVYSDFLNLLVPPRGEAQVTLHGPRLARIPPGTTLGVFLYDVVTSKDQAGNVTRRQNFEWYFSYETRQETVQLPVATWKEWVHRRNESRVVRLDSPDGIALDPVAEDSAAPSEEVAPSTSGPSEQPTSTAGAGGDSQPSDDQPGNDQLRITAEAANVRDGPGIEAQVLFVSERGTVFSILGEEGNWFRILITPEFHPTASEAFVHNSVVEVIE